MKECLWLSWFSVSFHWLMMCRCCTRSYVMYHVGPGTTQTHHKSMKRYTKPRKS